MTNILVLGLGAVARCTLPLLLKHLDYAPEDYVVLDKDASKDAEAWVLAQGMGFERTWIYEESYGAQLEQYVGAGDIIVDLAWNTGTVDLLEWCSERGVRFVNASLEVWDPYAEAASAEPRDRTLYARHMELRSRNLPRRGPTAILDHGANPGLVSHFVKRALEDLAAETLQQCELDPLERDDIEAAVTSGDYALTSMLLGVKTIHISERDTQISNQPKQVGEFVNTWSVEGFYEESIAPAELGWGTHEWGIPPGAQSHHRGPQNQIALREIGCRTWVRSWVPSYGEIQGMVIRHGEAFSISEHLTVLDRVPLYRPTVHYAYCPADAAIASLHELEMRRLRLQPEQRIMTDDIVSGRDELGVLLLGHRLNGWWYGSSLDIHETRHLVGAGHNATVLQVAASVLAAVMYARDFPDEGVLLPDDLPHDYVLDRSEPYLGSIMSVHTEWTPTKDQDLLGSGPKVPESELWQFNTFRVR